MRNLVDPIRVDSTDPHDPMAQLAMVLLGWLGQMERTYFLERAAHARVVATAEGRRRGRLSVVGRLSRRFAYLIRLAAAAEDSRPAAAGC